MSVYTQDKVWLKVVRSYWLKIYNTLRLIGNVNGEAGNLEPWLLRIADPITAKPFADMLICLLKLVNHHHFSVC